MSVFLLVIGLILIIGLIVTHELGHFIVARRNGVVAEEFGIFFPPRLYKRRMRGGWDFTINLLPFGGFVKMKGEHDSDTEKGSFGAASMWAKTKIMLAGVAINVLTALLLFTFLALIGLPKLVDNQFTVKSDTKLISNRVLITYIVPGSPAAKGGLKPRDEITALAQPGYSPVDVTSAAKLPAIAKSFAGKKVTIYYIRDGQNQEGHTTLLTSQAVQASQKTKNPKVYLGVAPLDYSLQRSTWSAPIVAVGLSTQLTVLTYQGIGHALGGLGSTIAGAFTHNKVARQNGQTTASAQVAGPVGIFQILQSGSELGYQFVLTIVAVIALTLGIMNVLPIPALDGGRLYILLVSRWLKRPLNAQREEAINAIGFVALIALIILTVYVDIQR